MVTFPNAKINLGLHILQKREDGYHNLETVFYPVAIKDALEIIPAEEAQFSHSGLPILGDTAGNLCIKAIQLLQQDFPELKPVQLHLHKHIPMGAGLGGGSADGAFTLQAINQLFQLQLSEQQLISYALQLGSDCPFFILNRPAYATGRGELLQPIELDLSAYQIILINPGIHVPTSWAFAQRTPVPPAQPLRSVIQRPVHQWKDHLFNDFEAPVSLAHPAIAAIKQQLYHQGATYAAMSGSGSTVFGIFPKNNTPTFSFPPHYLVLIPQT